MKRERESRGCLDYRTSCSANFSCGRCARRWPCARERASERESKRTGWPWRMAFGVESASCVAEQRSWILLSACFFSFVAFAFRRSLVAFPRSSRDPLQFIRDEYEDEDEKKGIGTNLSGVRKDRANPRTTRRWTTWRHVASELAANPRDCMGGKRDRGINERTARGEIERRSCFLGTPTNGHGRYKALPLVRYSESASVVLVLSPASAPPPSAVLKRRVFARA